MIETELHDLSDDADYAASQQQGSQSMMRSDSGRRSEPEGSEIVYMKDNVSIHPTQYMSERISGRLKLVKQGDSLFMTWIPYKGQNTNARLSERDRNLYTIRPLPFTDVRSIRRHTPPLGWQYIIVVLSSGLAFPPLYFYNGGVKEFLTTIKQHVSLVRSADDANVFIVNDFQDPLQKTLSSLELPGVVSVAAPSTNASAAVSPTQGNQGRTDVLEKFSLVTKFARETTSQLFGESSGDQLFSNDLKKHSHSQSLPDLHSQSSNDLEEVPCEAPVPADPMELEKTALVWGKPRQPPMTKEEWLTFLDSEGRVVDSIELRKRIFYGGVVHELRKEVWPFLLGCYDYNSTYAEREYLRSVRKQDYEIIKLQWQSISPEQAKRFTKFRERKGLIEKDVVRTDRSFSFYDGDDNPNVNLLHDILLTYSFYNFDLGYCQGMSDYLSPLLFVMEDEFEVFWCFAALMERVGPNFNRDQSGMHAQLFALSKLVELSDSPLHNYFKQQDCLNYFFCFRWILIQFKREMRYEETMRLWEILWTHYPSEHLHLYICVAILKRYRNKIIGEQMDFDTLLKFINGLSGQIDLDSIVRDAEALCICAGETGEACIPPGTPPSLPVENGLVSSQLEDEVL
ncbi:TBC1 domain family member 15-like isoform X2 [Chenopodium quinoa]|uniref:TBC1 domain family member 15-like isoform X2 n=1 Tax=Chenopodium quinoa TaxID=63459 RepID=UPI000B791704|nr:TBC1 domain family member 15-like isoform X2 [Chenopodium quinoa]